MQAPGDPVNSIANPFEAPKPRISEYTATQIATLQSRLEKQLGPEYISSRAGPGGQKVNYIAADKCINLANEIFGFNGWSTSIQNIQVDFVDENPQTLKISLGLSMIVRVTLKDGTFHEDIGYGHIENCKGKAAAFEKSKKEAKTDALKRVLRNFGNVLGNCLYDKDYLSKVTKMKVTPAKFDESKLYRHADYMKKEQGLVVKVEQKAIAENENDQSNTSIITSNAGVEFTEDDFGDFDMADFGVTEDDHTDGVILPASHDQPAENPPTTNAISGNNAAERKAPPPNGYPTKPAQPVSRPGPQQGPRPPQTPHQPPYRPGGQFQQARPQPHQQQHQPPRPPGHANNLAGQQHISAAQAKQVMTPPHHRPQPHNPGGPPPQNAGGGASSNNNNNTTNEQQQPATFFSARAMKDIPLDADPATVIGAGNGAAVKVFNPKAESPSIRKTPGIDHRSSKPVSKTGVHVQPVKRDQEQPQGQGPQQQPQRSGPPNVVNPAMSQVRQIGAPGGGGSPLGNRGQYRPLTMKRPAPGAAAGATAADNNGNGNRPPLTEVSSNNGGGGGLATTNGAAAGMENAKRQKTS